MNKKLEALASQIALDTVMDMRRLLRSRGIDPDGLAHLPTCDICNTWTATHVEMDKGGALFLVCDKPRCQDTVARLGGEFDVNTNVNVR